MKRMLTAVLPAACLRHLLCAVGAVIVGAVLCACSGRQAPPPEGASTLAPMWRDFISSSLADPDLSDFVRQVLSDYQITDAEYNEARERFASCMADRGWKVTLNDHGYSVSGASGGPHADANSGTDDPNTDNGQCRTMGSAGAQRLVRSRPRTLGDRQVVLRSLVIGLHPVTHR